MGNYFSYKITQGTIFNDQNYIFTHNMMRCKTAIVLTIFYRYNSENNRIHLNTFLEGFSKGLLIHVTDANIAYIILSGYEHNYVIFYALYEEQIYNFLTSICGTYTFIDKEPNDIQHRDPKFKYFSHLTIPTNETHNFDKKYLEEYIFTVLNLNIDSELYKQCIRYKQHLYYRYCLNKESFCTDIIKLLIIKYNYYKISDNIYNIIVNDISQMHLICNHPVFTMRANNLIMTIKNNSVNLF